MPVPCRCEGGSQCPNWAVQAGRCVRHGAIAARCSHTGVQIIGTLLKGCAYAMEHNHRHVMLQDVPNFAKGRVCVKDIMKKNIVIGSLVVMRGVQDKVVKEGYVCFMVLFRNCLANIRDVPTDKLGVNKDFVGDMAQRRDKEDQKV